MHNFTRVSNTMLKFRKRLMIQFQKNAKTEGQNDIQILFYWTLPATARGSASRTAVSWYLKSKIQSMMSA